MKTKTMLADFFGWRMRHKRCSSRMHVLMHCCTIHANTCCEAVADEHVMQHMMVHLTLKQMRHEQDLNPAPTGLPGTSTASSLYATHDGPSHIETNATRTRSEPRPHGPAWHINRVVALCAPQEEELQRAMELHLTPTIGQRRIKGL